MLVLTPDKYFFLQYGHPPCNIFIVIVYENEFSKNSSKVGAICYQSKIDFGLGDIKLDKVVF